MTRSLVRRKSSRRQTSPQRCAEISADVSDERSNMSWVCFDKCRKVARLQCLQGEDVPFAGCSCAAFRLFCFGGTNYENETSSKSGTQMSILWQPFGFEKCRRYLSQQFQEYYAICLQQISRVRFLCPGASRDKNTDGYNG